MQVMDDQFGYIPAKFAPVRHTDDSLPWSFAARSLRIRCKLLV